jgi:hypothetical protein
MWHVIRNQLNTLRNICFEIAPKSITYFSSYSSSQQSLNSSLESPSSAPLQLVTAFYGISKEILFNGPSATVNKKKCTYGDDSW